MNQMVRYISLISAILLVFLRPERCLAEVQSMKADLNPPGTDYAILRQYTAFTKGNPDHKIIFTAKKMIAGKSTYWYLYFTPDESSAGEDVHQEDVLGKEGLVFQCLDRFLADEPSANNLPVDTIEVGMNFRLNSNVWNGVEKTLAPLFRNWDGVVSGVERKKLAKTKLAIGVYVENSPDAKAMAKNIADRLKCDIGIPIGVDCENMGFEHHSYEKPWHDLLTQPHLGIAMNSLSLTVSLTPKKHRST